MDNKMKGRNCVDKYRSKCKEKRRGFHVYKAENVTTTITLSESMHMKDGDRRPFASHFYSFIECYTITTSYIL